MNANIIRNKIYEIRGQKVMLDFDLAELYGVETRAMNQAVKRNSNRFPEDFMFQLTAEEWAGWSQNVMSVGDPSGVLEMEDADNQEDGNSSQNVMSSEEGTPSQTVMTSGSGKRKNRGAAYLPYAFTEHGVTMLASVLRSEKAVTMSIAVVRAFIALKQYVVRQHSLTEQLQEIRDRLGEHDVQLNSIYAAIENLLDEKAEKKSWEDRERIGFKK